MSNVQRHTRHPNISTRWLRAPQHPFGDLTDRAELLLGYGATSKRATPTDHIVAAGPHLGVSVCCRFVVFLN